MDLADKRRLSQQVLLLMVVPFISLFAAMTAHAETRVPIVLSTDVGNEIDDQWAIAYLLTAPGFDVRGILSAHAPSLPDPSAHASFEILRDVVERRLGMRSHPPLLEGASLPLRSLTAPQPSAAASFLIAQSKSFTPEHRLTVAVIGAATDVSSALLLDPSLADRIRVVAMAFRNLSPGGAHEYNEENDPMAWQLLMRSRVPLVVGTADTCERFLSLNYAQAEALLAHHGPAAAWLWEEYRAWYFRNVKPLRVDDFSKSWVIWDLITLAYVRGLATAVPQPRPELDSTMTFGPGRQGETIEVITAVDTARLWPEFTAGLDRIRTASPEPQRRPPM